MSDRPPPRSRHCRRRESQFYEWPWSAAVGAKYAIPSRPSIVIPEKASIKARRRYRARRWIPACAGMTSLDSFPVWNFTAFANSSVNPMMLDLILVEVDTQSGFRRHDHVAVGIVESFADNIVLIVNAGYAACAFAFGRRHRHNAAVGHHAGGSSEMNIGGVADPGFHRTIDVALHACRLGHRRNFLGFEHAARFSGID